MPIIPFKGLYRPMGRYKEILDYILRPSPDVKMVDLCCGLGFSKTILGIQAAALTMDSDPRHIGLFFEPDWSRVDKIFLPLWEKHVPEQLYTHKVGKNLIEWHNGAKMFYMARVITGQRDMARARTRGIPTSFVIDDETAIGFDEEQYQNTHARIREAALQRYYLTLTTPLVGPYARFLKRGGNKIFHGRTRDNHYLLLRDPDYEKRQRALMSHDQARRELDGEIVALEGRIWKKAMPEIPWPQGNRHDEFKEFDPKKPWWLFCDFGSSTGAYAIVQQTDAVILGQRAFREHNHVWVAVADYCPDEQADAASAFALLDAEFGRPVCVVGGADVDTRANTDGSTIAYMANQVWPNVSIIPCSETRYNKLLQFNRMQYLVCNAFDERRFCVAKKFRSLDDRSKRGIREMLDEDQYPPIEKRRENDFLPKNKDNIVQHIRDALLMGAVSIMAKPRWAGEARVA